MIQSKLLLDTVRATMLTGSVVAQDAPGPADMKISYAPYPTENVPNRVQFGGTHLQTSCSTGAGMIDNTLGPEGA